MKLNTEGWKEYVLGDYFDVMLSKGDLKLEECERGDIPLVSSGTSNNGIVGYVDSMGDGKAEIFKGNCLTIDMFCNAFYQDRDFYAVSHGRINILIPKFELTPAIAMFIVSIINNERFKYSYGRAVYSAEASRMTIKLPVASSGTPDWGFMEQYIKSLKHKPIQTQNGGGVKITYSWL